MGQLFEELKRRNVFRVGIAYLVVGWLILQFLDVVVPIIGLPDIFAKAVLILLLIGLPVTLLLAWAFELTPGGIVKTENVDAEASATPATGRKLDRFIIVALVIALGYFIWERQTGEAGFGRVAGAPGKSIAVLPFADLSPGGDQEYFGDGIAEEILNVLTQASDLRVAGRTSSFSFKGINKDLRQIGKQLGVENILEGSIRKSGNRIRITAQLVSAEDGFHIWSQTYDRELGDIFAIQDQISRAIVDALQVKLAFGEPVTGPAGPDLEAYNLYLRGRQSLIKRGPDDLADAIRYFDVAIMIDPDFADAYASKAMAHSLLSSYGNWKLNVAGYATAKEAIDRALEIDPANAEALLARGINELYLGRNWSGAKAALEKALEIAPNNSEVMNFLGDYWIRVGNVEEAIKYDRRAFDLDPLSFGNGYDLGLDQVHLGRYEDAMKLVDQIIEAAPDIFTGYWLRSIVLIAQNRLAELQEMIDNMPPTTDAFFISAEEYQARLFLLMDQPEAAAPFIAELERRLVDGLVYPTRLAGLYLMSGDETRAAELLELAYENRDAYLSFYDLIIFEPEYRDHPVVRALLEKPELKELDAMRTGYAQLREYRKD
ncbi:MAG: tetratricopeptide repeat protein [Sphingomonadales bacterium]